MSREMEIRVERSSSWHYMRKFRSMKETVEKALPNVSITDSKGRKNSFEITVNGTLVYSKLDSGNFPDLDQIVGLITGQSVDKEQDVKVKQEADGAGSEPSTNGHGDTEKKPVVKKAGKESVKKESVKKESVEKESVVKKEPSKETKKRRAVVADDGVEKRVTRSRKWIQWLNGWWQFLLLNTYDD